MPMPALNIIAIQDTVLNSGSSSSLPSGIGPYRLERQPEHEDDEAGGGEHEHPAGVVHHPGQRRAGRALRDVVLTNPQTRKATAMAAATPNTT